MERQFSSSEFAAAQGIKPQTARRWRQLGRGPKYKRLTDSKHSRVFYTESSIKLWREGRPSFASTAEEREGKP